MLPNSLKKLTAIVALALVGLVGGIGTGLHVSLNNCCQHSHGGYGCHSHSHGYHGHSHQGHSHRGCYDQGCRKHLAHSIVFGDQSTQATWSESASDCSICKILASYHSTETHETDQVVTVANDIFFFLPDSIFVAGISNGLEPTRGPPALIL